MIIIKNEIVLEVNPLFSKEEYEKRRRKKRIFMSRLSKNIIDDEGNLLIDDEGNFIVE